MKRITENDRIAWDRVTLLAVVVALCFALFGCGAEPIDSKTSGNPDVRAGVIAEIDGCKVYRLYDGHRQTIYFVRCPNFMTQTSWETGGKHSRYYRIDTESR